ncbi:LysR family transcriptional regulator [Fulvimarina sp. MAC3]|uniref:LysR family transcriptional regulator n=1 Tax=Fulvimarina sp. MAC3 TaxID=3148887 RepID=UPI0031FDBD8D
MARLNSDEIRSFLATVRLGGLNKAAVSLNISQPAVTARIKKLELSLGKLLFERTQSGMRLTSDGEIFYVYAERFEHLSELVEEHVIADCTLEGFLRIGASETVTQCWLPDFVSRLHQRFPKLRIEIDVDISVNLRAALLNYEIDLAFLLGPISEHRVDNIELPPFELGWYRSVQDERPGASEASWLKRPVITYGRQTQPYRVLKERLLEHVGPDISMFPSSSLSACFRLVEAGIGVAALPETLARPYLEKGTICTFNPGWKAPALCFTASYIGDPKRHLVEQAARLSREAAIAYVDIKNPDTKGEK